MQSLPDGLRVLVPPPRSPDTERHAPVQLRAMPADRTVRLAILTQYYPPEIGAPQARLASLAESLARRGHQVTVLTAMPNYPTGTIQRGYRGLLRQEHRNGVRVIHSCLFPTQRSAMVPRLACYLSFVASSAVAGTALLGPDGTYSVAELQPSVSASTERTLR